MDARLLELLVCPLCKGRLQYLKEEQFLACGVDKLAFPIRDDIPVMLENEAKPWDKERGFAKVGHEGATDSASSAPPSV